MSQTMRCQHFDSSPLVEDRSLISTLSLVYVEKLRQNLEESL